MTTRTVASVDAPSKTITCRLRSSCWRTDVRQAAMKCSSFRTGMTTVIISRSESMVRSASIAVDGRVPVIIDQGLHGGRSEEHTSELQSLRHLVCRLLLEKKKKKNKKSCVALRHTR